MAQPRIKQGQTIYDAYKTWMASGGSASNSPYGGTVSNLGGKGGSGSGSGSGETAQSPLAWGIDMLGRPLNAVMGALSNRVKNTSSAAAESIKEIRSGKIDVGSAFVRDMLKVASDPGGDIAAAWEGLTSTDPAARKFGVDIVDQAGTEIAKAYGNEYVAPTLDNFAGKNTAEDAGHLAAALGRGVGGFALDVGFDPLTYGTLGVGTGVRLAAKGVKTAVGSAKTAKAAKAATAAGAATNTAADVERVAARAASEAGVVPTAPIAEAASVRVSDGAPAGGTFGAANVASVPSPSTIRSALTGSTASASVPKIKSAAVPKLPKVSETIKTHSGGVVEALLKTSRELNKVTKSAKELAAEVAPASTKVSSKGTNAAATPADLGGFARQFFGDAENEVVKLAAGRGGPVGSVFPSTIVNSLSSSNPQQVQMYWNRLVAAAKDPATSTPQLREFLTAASRFMQDRKAAAAAKKQNPSEAAPVAASAEETPKGTSAELLNQILKMPSGKRTKLGNELHAAIGDKLFRQITSARTRPEVRDRVFSELETIAKNADSISPATFDGMHENVRHFVEDTLQLRREDFDLVTRQKVLEHELYAAQPKVTTDTARALSPEVTKGAQALTGLTHRELTNRYNDTIKRIVGDTFDPAKGKWYGGTYVYKDADMQYAIKDGKLGTYAVTTWINGLRSKIDEAVPVVTNTKTGYSGVPAASKTRARREQLPALLREVEDPFIAAGNRIGDEIDGEFIMMRPSHIYDAAEDLIRAARQAQGEDVARALSQHVDTVFFNPGTAAPDSLLYEASLVASRGGSREQIIDVLGRTKSKYNDKTIERQPMGVGRAGGRINKTQYTSEQLRDIAATVLQQMAPGLVQRSQGLAREFFEKSVTDAGAIATKVETELAEAAALGDGSTYAYLADLEKRVTQLSKDYGASGYAVGMAAEEIAKQLPPWAVKRAKSVRSTQTAYRNAATAGKSIDEIRVMGAVSEVRHVPVEVSAAAEDFDELVEFAKDITDEADELYGLGTDARSVLNEEMQNRALWHQMVHSMRTGFDAKYGATADGIDLTESTRWAVASSAKDIYYRSLDITEWSKKHNTVLISGTEETVGSAAFKLLQQGMDAVPQEMTGLPHAAHLAQALEELKPLARAFFDVDGAGMAGDLYWRAGSQNIRYLERSMETAGLTRKYGDVFTDRLVSGDVENWWRSLDVTNPAEFLHQYNIAVHHALGERTSMLRLVSTLRSSGLLSTTAKPGFAKPTLQGNSFFFAGLSESGAFVDKRVLDAMSEVDKRLYAARSFGENSLITAGLDPVLSAWKTGMTIYRPGHHVRNTLSNAMLAFVDQGARNLAKSGYVAGRLMAMREGNRGLAGMGELERLLTGAQTGLKGDLGSEVVYRTTTANGKKVELTYDTLNDAFSSRGGYRTFRQSEDIIEGQGLLQKAADAATFKGTRVEKIAGGVSEGLDHHGYLQHFTQIVMNNASKVGKGKFATLDDLYDFAINRAYRFHPDSAVLSPFESKYMRRVIPFYTWFRGTLPGIVETSFKHPGRTMLPVKASFNIAQTFGIDAESYSNPWPEDAEVPEYLRDGVFGANLKIGDQMFSLNPGFAHQDLAKMFFGRGPAVSENEDGEEVLDGNYLSSTLSTAGRSLVGMLNPMFRVPIELASGTKLETGAKIYDGADYIDDSLPYINYLTSGTGIQFTGNLLDPLGAIAQGRPHERSAVDRGWQPSIFEEGIGEGQARKVLNWLFGQGAQEIDTVDQAAQKEADRDARLAAREEGLDVAAAVADARATGVAPARSSGGSAGGSTSAKDVEELLAQLNIPSPVDAPAPAQLDIGAVDAIEELLRGSNTKPLTSSQRLSAAKDLQRDALRQQGAMYWPDYAGGNLEQLQQANPNLTLEQLLAILKYQTPYLYE